MNVQTNPDGMKFGIGQAAPRMEDPKLLRGEGYYTDDVNLSGQAHMWVVRSPVAHGILKGIDTAAAKAAPGVLAVYTQEDLSAAGMGGIPAMIIPLFVNRDGSVMTAPVRSPLATGKVRFAGEAVAAVIAETLEQAKDAAELVVLDIEPLPAVTDSAAGARPGAPQLHDDRPSNVALDYHYGDAEATAAAFAKAAHVTRMHIEQNRIVINAMEPRAAVAVHETDGDRYTFYTCGQGALGMRNGLVNNILKTTPDKVRVLMNNVGGSFGMKGGVYPEYPPMLLGAKQLGRPVKWNDDRSGAFLSDHHGRDQEGLAELALDKDGHFLAMRLTGTANTGAYAVIAYPMVGAVKHLPGAYTIPLIEGDMKFIYTNTTPVGAYRGAGRPEGNFYMERLIDTAAAEMGIDRVELRRRNYIKPEQMPFKNAATTIYDSGDFDRLMTEGQKQADVAGYPARKKASEARGKLRGLGIVSYIEISGAGNELGGIRFEEDGTVTMLSATHDHGQGHLSTFATVIHDKLGIPMDKIRLLQNDSDQLIGGVGTGGSRSAIASGSALFEASDEVILRGTKIAAHVLEAAEEDIRFDQGRFTITGTDRSVAILDLAARLRQGEIKGLPEDMPANLNFERVSTAGYGNTYPNGCHVAEVEIDPDTGVVEVVKYDAVNDFGMMLNPTVVDGQLHGGVMQGIGQALLEHTVYNEDGQLLSGSFTDYAMPRADSGPSFTTASFPIPTKLNPLGVKGCGEAGCAGSLPAVMNAIDDALRPLGVPPMNMPATPLRVWEAIRAAKA